MAQKQDNNNELLQETADFDLLTDNWGFNKMLLDLEKELDEKDLKYMKELVKGGMGLEKASLEKIKDAFDFFQILKDRAKLDKYNLLHLQGILWNIGRKDLCKVVAECAKRENSKPLHFFTPDEPAHGYIHLRIHVTGAVHTRAEIEKIRNLVSKLLIVTPIEHIYWVGLEPSNSIVVTFMVPTDDGKLLHTLTNDDKRLLRALNVDYIFLDDKEIPVAEHGSKALVDESGTNEVTTLLKENEKLKKEFQSIQTNLIQRNLELKETKKNAHCIYSTLMETLSLKLRAEQRKKVAFAYYKKIRYSRTCREVSRSSFCHNITGRKSNIERKPGRSKNAYITYVPKK